MIVCFCNAFIKITHGGCSCVRDPEASFDIHGGEGLRRCLRVVCRGRQKLVHAGKWQEGGDGRAQEGGGGGGGDLSNSGRGEKN